MKLYCYKCCAVHEFTGGAIERLVYTLQGQLLDAESELPRYDFVTMEHFICLSDHYAESLDADGYMEHCDNLRAARLSA